MKKFGAVIALVLTLLVCAGSTFAAVQNMSQHHRRHHHRRHHRHHHRARSGRMHGNTNS